MLRQTSGYSSALLNAVLYCCVYINRIYAIINELFQTLENFTNIHQTVGLQ